MHKSRVRCHSQPVPLFGFKVVVSSTAFGSDEFIKAERLLMMTRATRSGMALALGRDIRAMRCGSVKHEKWMNLPRELDACSSFPASFTAEEPRLRSTFSSREICNSWKQSMTWYPVSQNHMMGISRVQNLPIQTTFSALRMELLAS